MIVDAPCVRHLHDRALKGTAETFTGRVERDTARLIFAIVDSRLQRQVDEHFLARPVGRVREPRCLRRVGEHGDGDGTRQRHCAPTLGEPVAKVIDDQRNSRFVSVSTQCPQDRRDCSD